MTVPIGKHWETLGANRLQDLIRLYGTMARTDFRFEIRILSDVSGATLARLKEKLLRLNGIDSVTAIEGECILELVLSADFENSARATELHRTVMKVIVAHEGVVLSRVETILTDIF